MSSSCSGSDNRYFHSHSFFSLWTTHSYPCSVPARYWTSRWSGHVSLQQSAECVCFQELVFIISRAVGLNLIMSCCDFWAHRFGTGHQHARTVTWSRGAERHILCSVSWMQRARASSPLHPSPGVAPCYSHIINSRALSAFFCTQLLFILKNPDDCFLNFKLAVSAVIARYMG